jgi:hypothetical protein
VGYTILECVPLEKLILAAVVAVGHWLAQLVVLAVQAS